jgi:hypothetical protein
VWLGEMKRGNRERKEREKEEEKKKRREAQKMESSAKIVDRSCYSPFLYQISLSKMQK